MDCTKSDYTFKCCALIFERSFNTILDKPYHDFSKLQRCGDIGTYNLCFFYQHNIQINDQIHIFDQFEE